MNYAKASGAPHSRLNSLPRQPGVETGVEPGSTTADTASHHSLRLARQSRYRGGVLNAMGVFRPASEGGGVVGLRPVPRDKTAQVPEDFIPGLGSVHMPCTMGYPLDVFASRCV